MHIMPPSCKYLTPLTARTFLPGVDGQFRFPHSSSISLDIREIHSKATSFGGSTADFPEQLVGDGTVKRRTVAGVDQEELLDPENLADHDSLFFEISGVKLHHKAYHYRAKEKEEEAFQSRIGFPVILLHGFGASVFSWGRIMKPLAHIVGSKVLAFDRPAFGLTSRTSYIENSETSGSDDKPLNPYSMAFSVLATLSFINMVGGKAILMGHSAGSFVALNTYFESPGSVAALILVAPAIFAPAIIKNKSIYGGVWKEKKAEDGAIGLGAVEDPISRIWHGVCRIRLIIASLLFGMFEGMKNMFSSIFAKAVAAILRSAFGVMLVRLVMDKFGILAVKNAWYDASQVTDDVLQGYTKPLRAKGWERALLEYTLAMLIGPASKPKPPLLERLSEISCPVEVYLTVLIVTGDMDRIVPSWNAQRLAQAIPGSTFEVIAKCGHLPQEEKPEELLEIIENFLYRTLGAQVEKFTMVAT